MREIFFVKRKMIVYLWSGTRERRREAETVRGASEAEEQE